MPLAFSIEPATDESLAGFVVRATARNFLRSPLGALSSIGIRTVRLGSLSRRSSLLATSIAEWAGTENVEAITSMFHRSVEGRKGWIDFFGEPLRAMYRHPELRRVAPGALKNGDYMRATWSLRPLSFDPATKELLIDSCPQCKCSLGWTRTYGVSYCDHCSRPEIFGQFTWHYPGLDLRDFPQSKIQVDDEEALDFLTGLIDPSPVRKERSRRLVPEMWSPLSAGDLFEVGLTFACMLDLDHWDKQQTVTRRKGGSSWSWLTPRMLSIGGRALLGGQPGFEMFGDILRREAKGKPREKKYGKWAEIGPLSIVEPTLCDEAKTILRKATESYVVARRNPDMQPLQKLADKYGIARAFLSNLAESGFLPTTKPEGVRRGPVMMSESALEPLLREKENTISAARAAAAIGVHPAHMEELQKLGLLEKVEGAVLKLLKAEAYYTRQSVDILKERIQCRIARRAPKDCLRLRVAVRGCHVQAVPWAGIVQSILNGELEVFRIKAYKSHKALGDRLAVRDARALASLIQRLSSVESGSKPEWIGNAAASEMLGVNEVAVWRLAKAGALRKHNDGPQYLHFKRSEVEYLKVQTIFAPEIGRTGSFRTYREASAWLKQHGIAPRLELKRGGWKVYSRAEVERALKRRVDELPKEPVPRSYPTGQRHGPDSPRGKLAAAQELLDASKVGYATAASILGCTIFAVQKLVSTGHLTATEMAAPFCRAEVETLAKRIVFVPEIMLLSGYVSYVGVMNWLENAGIEPQFWLRIGGVPVFDRAVVEEHVARPEFIRGAHPRWIKRKLLGMVQRGSSVHQASIDCGVSYATAKKWASTETAPDSP